MHIYLNLFDNGRCAVLLCAKALSWPILFDGIKNSWFVLFKGKLDSNNIKHHIAESD